MTGLKSGSGDDLWGDDGDSDSDNSDGSNNSDDSRDASAGTGADAGDGRTPDREPKERDRSNAESGAHAGSDTDTGATDEPATESSTTPSDESGPTLDASTTDPGRPSDSQSYIVRRAVQDKSVQFERDERLTFFVHDDVADGERDLITELESTLGRDVPKFDVREAVYRAALRNPNDVLEELLAMGYSIDED